MGNKFCKFKDIDNQTYVITDKKNQPLSCQNNTCVIGNYQKVIDFPGKYQNLNEETIFENTSISCNYKNDGLVEDINYIDPKLYNFASYYSGGGYRTFYNDSEPTYYFSYSGLTDKNNKIKYEELKTKHNVNRNLFKEVIVKAQYAKKLDDKTFSIIEYKLSQNNNLQQTRI